MAQNIASQKIKRIKQISVTNLFGVFNHTIPLHLDDRITIIHGPNGFGKTAILRLLSDLFNKSDRALRIIPFSELHIDFDDGTRFWVTKNSESTSKKPKKTPPSPEICFHFRDHNSREQSYTSEAPSLDKLVSQNSFSLSMIDHFIPELERVDQETWIVLPTREILSLEDILEQYGERLPVELNEIPEWLKDVRKSAPIRFIETQRLLNLTRAVRRREYGMHPIMIPTVNMYSEELVEVIKTKLAESTALAQSLDRTFPSRLVNPTTRNLKLGDAELRQKLADLEKKRTDLMDAGLVDQVNNETVQILENDKIDSNTQIVLSVYVEDVEKKLGVFDEIAKKIDLLKTIINKRFLHKEMAISRKNGFLFTKSDGAVLAPNDLSSGEQHELVLFYELLFKVDPGSLILIDEPELSLHIVWQKQFLQDVQEVTRLSDIDILMATHSPSIIHNRWDLTVGLEEPNS